MSDIPIFYKIMNYPVPKNKELFFLFNEKKDFKNKVNLNIENNFSWENKNLLIDEYISFINKYGFLYRSLPFVKQIFLSNSITFNATDEDSDIDLFLICKENRIWTSRFFSVIFFQIMGIRRYFSKIKKRFDLGFYVTENTNLYEIILKPYDIYFSYWLNHLVLLYTENEQQKNNIFISNKWLKDIFPNINLQQQIFLGNKIFLGNSFFKNFIEKILNGFFGDIIESFIKILRLPIMIFKTKKIGKKAWGIVISDNILKFHGDDIRKIVNLKFKSFKKHQ